MSIIRGDEMHRPARRRERSWPATGSSSSARRTPRAPVEPLMSRRAASGVRRHRDLRRRRGWARRSRACCSTAASACASSRAARSGRARSPRSCRGAASSTPPRSTPSSSSASGSAGDGRRVRAQRRSRQPVQRDAGQSCTASAYDRARPRPVVARGLRAGRRRRRHQPAPGDRRGARALRARPAHPPDRDARRRPLRDPRPDRPGRVRARATRASTTCPRPAR